MKKILLVATVIYGCSVTAYDQCKDILRDGVRDTLSTNNTLDRQLAVHHQFCSISREHNLSENNFDTFAKDYANAVRSSTNSYGGGASVGIGPFSFGGNYGQNNNNNDMSTSDKENLLKAHKKKVIDYYKQNCGEFGYEDSLKTEAVLLSKVANENIVKAWRDCMLNKMGFFADVIPSSTEDNEIEYDIMVSWRSNENTTIDSIVLRYLEAKIRSPYVVTQEQNGYVKTANLCEYEGCVLTNGGSIPLSVNMNRTVSTNLKIMAKTNTGVAKSHILVLPKLVVPPPVGEDSAEESYWLVENYCGNSSCANYMQNISSVKHNIGEQFLADTNQLNAGTCERCGQFKNVRFGFKNCRYKYKCKKGVSVFQSNENISQSTLQYTYPFSNGMNFYDKIRVLTSPIHGPSFENDQD